MDHIERIRRAQESEAQKLFEDRVASQTAFLHEQLENGVFDNQEFTVGLELEAYAVDADKSITSITAEMLEEAPFNPELGLQNLELNTSPSIFDEQGLEHQKTDLFDAVEETRTFLQDNGMELVLDSIWTRHSDHAARFLSEVEEQEGYVFASNMREAGRYYLLDNGLQREHGEGVTLSLPGADHVFPSVLFESLATSIQPHLQVPGSDSFAAYFNASLRTVAPLLALTTNSPFLPPELYDDGDAGRILDETFHELRIPIFEQAVNPGESYGEKKVRFPRDLSVAGDAFDLVADDAYYDATLQEWIQDESDSFRDRFWEWNYKRKTFWRWVRPVVGGEPVQDACGEKSLRIEYRPLPTQPTVRDILSLQYVTVGLIHGLVLEDHPALDLGWEEAKADFYSVVEDGLNADFRWKTNDGTTTDIDVIYEDLFRVAEAGLADRGIPEEKIAELVGPLKKRWKDRMTPSTWKKEQVRRLIEDGRSLEEAIHEMQAEYIRLGRNADTFQDVYQ